MGGCVCKLEGGLAAPQTDIHGDNSKSQRASGFTINNNYNNNTISIIDGGAITASSGHATQRVGQGLVSSAELNDLQSVGRLVSPPVTSTRGGQEFGSSAQTKDRSGMQLPLLSQKQLSSNGSETANLEISSFTNPLDLSSADARGRVNMSLISPPTVSTEDRM